ncbi:hypothetical protein M2323_000536 [Rhodoblastus acidophilus]|nr:hypothetical protein [Rhodoblastus acidophilus]MCW2331632.1 hypothetical protein [Rhodoblastus acidophilus]
MAAQPAAAPFSRKGTAVRGNCRFYRYANVRMTMQIHVVMAGRRPGHPRGAAMRTAGGFPPRAGVDARDKPGHDALGLKLRWETQPRLFPRRAVPLREKGGAVTSAGGSRRAIQSSGKRDRAGPWKVKTRDLHYIVLVMFHVKHFPMFHGSKPFRDNHLPKTQAPRRRQRHPTFRTQPKGCSCENRRFFARILRKKFEEFSQEIVGFQRKTTTGNRNFRNNQPAGRRG